MHVALQVVINYQNYLKQVPISMKIIELKAWRLNRQAGGESPSLEENTGQGSRHQRQGGGFEDLPQAKVSEWPKSNAKDEEGFIGHRHDVN